MKTPAEVTYALTELCSWAIDLGWSGDRCDRAMRLYLHWWRAALVSETLARTMKWQAASRAAQAGDWDEDD